MCILKSILLIYSKVNTAGEYGYAGESLRARLLAGRTDRWVITLQKGTVPLYHDQPTGHPYPELITGQNFAFSPKSNEPITI